MAEAAPVPRRLVLMALLALESAGLATPAAAGPVADWPSWQRFKARFIAEDGRVIDHGTPREHSTSEGQAYAMFFAVVANDRPAFDRVWGWAVDQLCGGQAGERLPAWQWGRLDNGSWDVIDANPASDADLWMAYALLEAGRHWGVPAYRLAGQRLLALVQAQELVDLPGFGPMLLPGPTGFATAEDGQGAPTQWRLNPSYLPLPVLAAFGRVDPAGPWQTMAANTVRMVQAIAPHGMVADWVDYRREGGFVAEPKSAVGSYDAIRVYLWAGVAAPSRLTRDLLKALGGMATAISPSGNPPQSVNAADGSREGVAPAGFSAALLPYLAALGQVREGARQRQRAQTMFAAQGDSTRYYDQVLGLFGLGWAERRYRFLSSGQLWLPRKP